MDDFTAIARAGLRVQAKPAGSDKPVKELILPGESFVVAGRPAFILTPAGDRKRTPQPWIFYAPTLPGYPDSHEKWMHEQFVAAGVAVAGIDVGEAFGSPEGRRLFTEFYRELTEKRGFSPPALPAGPEPRRPLGLELGHRESGQGRRNRRDLSGLRSDDYPGLDKAAPAYGLAAGQFEARLAEFNPIERVGVLAKHRVPAIFIHGDEDKVVPLKENSAAFVARYRAAGAGDSVTLIEAKGQGHNFWEGFFTVVSWSISPSLGHVPAPYQQLGFNLSTATAPGPADQVLKPGETTDRGEVGIFVGFRRIRARGQGTLEQIERLA